MPLIPTAMQGLMQGKAASKSITGSKSGSLASAISQAASQYILSASTVTSTNQALGPGSGTQIGRVVGVNPSAMSSLMVGKAAASGISGRDTQKLCESVAFGVCNALNTVIMQGTIIGAGPGSGTGKILGLVPTILQGIIVAQCAGKVISGSKLSALAGAIAFGICTHILTVATVSITDIGAAAPPPAGTVTIPTAPGTGRFV